MRDAGPVEFQPSVVLLRDEALDLLAAAQEGADVIAEGLYLAESLALLEVAELLVAKLAGGPA